MVAAAETSLYDWMMIISVVLGYIDQVTDLMFVFASKEISRQLRAFAGFYVLFFLLVRTGMAVAQGRGLPGALLALSGAELAVRGWQAYRSKHQEVIERWKEVVGYISIESILEGIPLVSIAALYMYQLRGVCWLLTCDPATIARVFPSDVLTLPAERRISAAEVLAIHSHGPHCAHLPLTDDGWFTMDYFGVNATHADRPAGPFRRIVEMEISGSAMEQITGAPSPSFTCVGIHTRYPGTWTALALSSRALIPSLSIICGILCSAYHLSRMFSTDHMLSLWALPDAVAAAPAAPGGSGTACVSDPAALGAASGRRGSSAGARVHPDDGAPRRPRLSMQSVRSALSARPQLGPVVAHHAAAFAYFAVDIAFVVCLWIEIIQSTLVAVPHVEIFAVQALSWALVAGVKAWLVVGRFGRVWLAALGQMIWTVTPLRVTNPWTLRVAPRRGPYAAVMIGIAVNGAVLALATATPAAMARGGGYPWRISWQPLLVLWCMYGMHMALMRLAFWTHARALSAADDRPPSEAHGAKNVAEVQMAVPEGLGGERVAVESAPVAPGQAVDEACGSVEAGDVKR